MDPEAEEFQFFLYKKLLAKDFLKFRTTNTFFQSLPTKKEVLSLPLNSNSAQRQKEMSPMMLKEANTSDSGDGKK